MQHVPGDILSRLDQVIKAWPNGWRSDQHVSVELQSLITSDFDRADLLHELSGVAELLHVSAQADRTIVEFLDRGGSPQRAIFVDIAPGEWRLQSMKFQCCVCFGSGQNLEETCMVCGGMGWGAE